MADYLDDGWRDDFIVRRAASPEDAATRRAIDGGELVRIIRGVYLPRSVVEQRSARAAHRDLAYAHEMRRPGTLTFSHASAAALWRLPRIGAWPGRAHVSAPSAAGGRSSSTLMRHTVGLDETDVIEGLMVTGLVRTVIDLARSDGFLSGVVAADAAMRGISFFGRPRVAVTSDALIEEMPRPGERGAIRARAVAAFADGRSGSPGESLSRVRMKELGIPMPELQVRLSDEAGDMFVDFCWPAFGIVGEFDGHGKYLRTEFTNGRSAAEVVIDEKWREDRLRLLGWRVVRWGWHEALSRERLRARLAAAGIRAA